MIQNLRKIALVLDVSGTATALKNTKLYQGSFGFVGLQVYVPITPNRSLESSPLCTVHRVTIDSEGVRTQYDNEVYNLLYVDTAILNGNEYLLFERPLPKTFTDIEGNLEIVINYSEIKDDVITSRLATNIYATTVYAGGTADTDLDLGLSEQEAAQINANTIAIEEINETIAEVIEAADVANEALYQAGQAAAGVTILDAAKLDKKTTVGEYVYSHNGETQDEIVVEDTPTNDSDNLVKSGGIKAALDSLNSAQATALGLKVDKTTEIAGKAIGTGISKADLLTALNVADGAEVNVNPDWNAVSGDAQILNKPTTISGYGITDAYTKAEVDTKMSVVYRYKGSKTTYEELPATGQEVGDTYNIVNAHTTAPVFGAGSNLTWSGTGWDILSGDLAHKTDKVLAATEDNFVAFDGGGNIKDSGKKATDFLLTTDISAWAKAANKPSYNSGEITYDKTASGMSATDVKAAIDELNADKLSKADKYTAPIELDYNSTNNYWDWDYSDGDNALIEMSGSELTTDINIINATAGDIGVLTVKGGQLTLPLNSVLSADFGYITAVGEQYYRYSFYFNGTNFEWHRTVLGEEDD